VSDLVDEDGRLPGVEEFHTQHTDESEPLGHAVSGRAGRLCRGVGDAGGDDGGIENVIGVRVLHHPVIDNRSVDSTSDNDAEFAFEVDD